MSTRPRSRPSSSPAARRALAAAGLALCAAGGLYAAAAAANPLPALPGSGPGNAAPASGAAPSTTAEGTLDAGALLERARRGVVVIERDGRPSGVGTVLANDGRVLTALSALRGSDTADLRYTDGHAVKARVGHSDPAWDLALLVPLSGRWTEGLTASEVDPAGIELKALVPARVGAKSGASPIGLKGRTDARSSTGDALANALDLELKGLAFGPGTPLVDGMGSVIGVLVRACRADADAQACAAVTVGAPVAALRAFLVRTPLNAVQPSPFLGINGVPDQSGSMHGVRVMAIAPQSPAEKAGLKANADRAKADLIVAVDGHPVDTPEALAELIGKHAVGESVKLLVFGGDKLRDVTVALRAAP